MFEAIGRYLPLYEAKLFHQYDHRFATFHGVQEEALRGGNARDMTSVEKADPLTVVIPRYWVPEEEVTIRLDKREETSQTSSSQTDRQTGISQQSDSDRQTGRPIASRFGSSPERPTFVQHSVQSSALRAGAQGRNDTAQEWELALRLITNATNQRTVMATLIPAVGLGHKGAIVKLCPGLSLSERQPEGHG